MGHRPPLVLGYTLVPNNGRSNVRSLVVVAPLSSDLDSTQNQKAIAKTNTLAAAAYDPTTTVTWTTFIPEKRVESPGRSWWRANKGCDYGGKYFGGDGHD